MRTHLIFVLIAAATLMAANATAQEESDRLVMYVGAGPDYTTSLGLATQQGDQVTIQQRLQMGAGCSWTPSDAITVPVGEIIDIRDPSEVGGAERLGVLYATTYSALAGYRGGSPAVENHTCIRQTMTALASGAMPGANAPAPPAK